MIRKHAVFNRNYMARRQFSLFTYGKFWCEALFHGMSDTKDSVSQYIIHILLPYTFIARKYMVADRHYMARRQFSLFTNFL